MAIERWQVHGIDVPDIVDELIEWDNLAGLTEHNVNKDTHQVYTTCFVPRVNNARGRTVVRHEFLHAIYDTPTVRDRADEGHPLRDDLQSAVESGIGDAFVHMVYWPVGKDKTADHEAVEMALGDVRNIADDPDRENWSIGRVLLITLRSMAILKTVGTELDQMYGSQIILSYLTAAQVADLSAVLGAVKQEDRAQATKLFTKVIKEAEKD